MSTSAVAQGAYRRRFEQDGLTVDASGSADDGVLDAFYPAYDAAFVLPNEKEAFDGFRDCLALNRGPDHVRLARQFGEFQEIVCVVRDGLAGPVLGGANFLLLHDLHGGAEAPPQPSLNLNYLFVARAARGRGLSRTVLGACLRICADAAKSALAPLCFLELNDPFRLTPEAYRLDSEHAGIDQLARLGYWAGLHAAVLDWPYVQPALSADQADDDTLAYALLDPRRPSLPAGLLLAHLERFFAISVLKGAALDDSDSAQRQLRALRTMAGRGEEVALLPLAPALRRLSAMRERIETRPARLADALKETG